MHSMGVVHRDLKLENVLLDGELKVKLGDLGFVREWESGRLLETFCGTTGYASPEMLTGKKYVGEGESCSFLRFFVDCFTFKSFGVFEGEEELTIVALPRRVEQRSTFGRWESSFTACSVEDFRSMMMMRR